MLVRLVVQAMVDVHRMLAISGVHRPDDHRRAENEASALRAPHAPMISASSPPLPHTDPITLRLATSQSLPARRGLLLHGRLKGTDGVHEVASPLGAHGRVGRGRGRDAGLDRVAELCRLLGQ